MAVTERVHQKTFTSSINRSSAFATIDRGPDAREKPHGVTSWPAPAPIDLLRHRNRSPILWPLVSEHRRSQFARVQPDALRSASSRRRIGAPPRSDRAESELFGTSITTKKYGPAFVRIGAAGGIRVPRRAREREDRAAFSRRRPKERPPARAHRAPTAYDMPRSSAERPTKRCVEPTARKGFTRRCAVLLGSSTSGGTRSVPMTRRTTSLDPRDGVPTSSGISRRSAPVTSREGTRLVAKSPAPPINGHRIRGRYPRRARVVGLGCATSVSVERSARVRRAIETTNT